MNYVNSITELIGNTPIIKLTNIVLKNDANIFVKLESFNPGGSIKDRIALSMINDMREKGLINHETVLVEPTSGNTGIGISMIGAALGYNVKIVMPDTMSKERQSMIEAYGASIVLTDGAKGMKGAIDKANLIASSLENHIVLKQFENLNNPKAHIETTSREIIKDLDGNIDYFIAGVGTGGTITGVGQVLREEIEKIKIIAVEPEQSAVLSGEKANNHNIQGIGAGFIPEVLNTKIYDEIIKVKYSDAVETVRKLVKEEGLFLGISSGAAIYAAIEYSKKIDSDKNIVVISPDGGEKYISTGIYEDLNLDKNKVAIAMSGGVDSTAAAYILKEQGYEVIGLTMRLFDEFDDNGNIIESGFIKDAKKAAKKLDISHYVVDYRTVFKEKIINEFRDEYILGKTPNPCVTCNREIKFGELLKSAHSHGAYYLATGHYSKIEFDKASNHYKILTSEANGKDQTYMFHVLTQDKLKYIKFPLGNFKTKEEIREIAKKVDIDISKKKDSQDICFIKDDDYIKYLVQNLKVKSQEGNFIDINGKILGRHKGIINYTIGQRKGLGISFGKPAYVIEIRSKTNEVVIGDNELTFKKGLIAKKYNFLSITKFDGLKVDVKIRYSAKPSKATIYKIDKDTLKVVFDEKERAITPGQAVVFYINHEVIGGALVIKSFN